MNKIKKLENHVRTMQNQVTDFLNDILKNYVLLAR